MARPLRIEFPGALYHIIARGKARQAIALDRADRLKFLELLAQCVDRYAWRCHAYCLMGNHYHLVIETGEATHSRGMTHKAGGWPWSSYRATAGLSTRPNWLQTDTLLSLCNPNKTQSQFAYQQFIIEGKGQSSPWQNLRNQVYLGNEEFVENMQCKMAEGTKLCGIPKIQHGPVKRPIEWYFERHTSREQSIVMAYRSCHYTQQEIGDFLHLSHTTISRIIRTHDVQMETCPSNFLQDAQQCRFLIY